MLTIALIQKNSLYLQGRNIEQHRIYEAIKCGSIPVLVNNSLARSSLPPEYFDSPIIFVQQWDKHLLSTLLALEQNKEALVQRQTQLMAWYQKFLSSRMADIDHEVDTIMT